MSNQNVSITEKYNNWLEKAKSGDKRFMFLTKTGDNHWYLVSNTRAEQIQSLKIAADHGNGLLPIYLYDSDGTETGEYKSTIVIKNESKMLVANEAQIDSYGIEGQKALAKALFIYMKIGGIHTFLFAHEKAPRINIVYECATQEDALWHCMVDIFSFPKELGKGD